MKLGGSIVIVAVCCFGASLSYADSIRTSDGVSCSFDTSTNPFEISSTVQRANVDNNSWGDNGFDPRGDNNRQTEYGVSFTYRFGNPKQLDCNRLFQMELREREAKAKLMEKKLELMSSSAEVDWESTDDGSVAKAD